MSMIIAGRSIGVTDPLFVIAEIGLNHGGSTTDALALVGAAARAGASAVKLQSLTADRLVAAHCPAPAHVSHASLRDFFRGYELDEAGHAGVADLARQHGLAFMSTPFDEDAVAMLERIGCDAYKIASGDITHHRLIEAAAATGKPMVLSTGMSELWEVGAALECARRGGAASIAVLHCVSAYPVPAGSQNLAAIATLAREFGVPVGLSDHGTDPLDLGLAVALGASVYEKHIVLDDDTTAIDGPVSATSAQLAALIAAAARAQAALGDGRKTCLPAEAPNRVPSRRGLYAARDLAPGDVIEAGDVLALRPAAAMPAYRWRDLVGSRVGRRIAAGGAFSEQDVSRAGKDRIDAA